MKRIRSYLIILCVVVLLTGCFSRKSQETGNTDITEPPPTTVNVEKTYDYLVLMEAKQFVITDPQGNSVSVDDVGATKSIVQYFTDLLIDDVPADYMYSLLIWQDGDPYVIQMNQTGLKVNETAYKYKNKSSGEKAIAAVEQALTQYYWETIVDVDRIYVNVDDIMKTLSVDDSEISSIVSIIKSSRNHNDGRVYKPLYPNYSLELSIGGKAQLEVQVLNSRMLSIDIGEKKFLYTTSQDLWSIVKRQVALPSYDVDDLFYLFQSEALSVKADNKSWEVGAEDDEYLQGYRDAITRELLVAMPVEEPFDKELMQLTYYVKGEQVNVHIGEQGFVYQGQHYRSNDILQRIKYLLDSL